MDQTINFSEVLTINEESAVTGGDLGTSIAVGTVIGGLVGLAVFFVAPPLAFVLWDVTLDLAVGDCIAVGGLGGATGAWIAN